MRSDLSGERLDELDPIAVEVIRNKLEGIANE